MDCTTWVTARPSTDCTATRVCRAYERHRPAKRVSRGSRRAPAVRRREIVVRNPRRSTARTRSTALGLHVSSHRRWERAAAVCRSVAIARKSLHTALFYRAWASDNAISSVGVVRADREPMRWNNSVVVSECCSELRRPSAGLRTFAGRGNPITTSDAGTRIIATR
jgi:hypothetical protein